MGKSKLSKKQVILIIGIVLSAIYAVCSTALTNAFAVLAIIIYIIFFGFYNKLKKTTIISTAVLLSIFALLLIAVLPRAANGKILSIAAIINLIGLILLPIYCAFYVVPYFKNKKKLIAVSAIITFVCMIVSGIATVALPYNVSNIFSTAFCLTLRMTMPAFLWILLIEDIKEKNTENIDTLE